MLRRIAISGHPGMCVSCQIWSFFPNICQSATGWVNRIRLLSSILGICRHKTQSINFNSDNAHRNSCLTQNRLFRPTSVAHTKPIYDWHIFHFRYEFSTFSKLKYCDFCTFYLFWSVWIHHSDDKSWLGFHSNENRIPSFHWMRNWNIAHLHRYIHIQRHILWRRKRDMDSSAWVWIEMENEKGDNDEQRAK